jgi:hypothetical protein
MTKHKIKLAMIVPALMILIGIIASVFPAIYTTLEHREYNLRYEHVQGHLNGVNSLAVSGNILYVLTNQSDCLVAFDLEGNPIYTIYFKPSMNGINSMLLLEDGSLVIDTMESGLQQFKDGVLIEKVTQDQPDYNMYIDMLVYEKTGFATNKAVDKDGTQYLVNLTGTGVDEIKVNSVERSFVVEPLPYWLLSFPFPSVAYIIVGLIMWYWLKRKLKSLTHEREFVKPDDFA